MVPGTRYVYKYLKGTNPTTSDSLSIFVLCAYHTSMIYRTVALDYKRITRVYGFFWINFCMNC